MRTIINRTPPTVLDDLLTRTGNGDERAFAALYDRCAATVHGLILRALRDPALSEDVTRAVWIRVWRSAHRYTRDQGTAMAWVMALAHRTVIGQIRSALPDTEPDDLAPARVGPELVPAARADPDRRSHPSSAARRRAVLLAYFDGCTTEQISTILRVPHDTVAAMINSGLLRLRSHIGESDGLAPRSPNLNTALDADGW